MGDNGATDTASDALLEEELLNLKPLPFPADAASMSARESMTLEHNSLLKDPSLLSPSESAKRIDIIKRGLPPIGMLNVLPADPSGQFLTPVQRQSEGIRDILARLETALNVIFLLQVEETRYVVLNGYSINLLLVHLMRLTQESRPSLQRSS
jgi:hypothetical protein